jgi:hypothetical protein
MTSPGLDAQPAMTDFVRRFRWPDTIVNAVDEDGSLWTHFGVRFRGTWLMVNQDGSVQSQSAGHISEQELRKRLESLVGA